MALRHELEKRRRKLDEIDRAIVRLLAERMQEARFIGRIKSAGGLPFEDRKREKRVLDEAVKAGMLLGLDDKAVRGVFSEIIRQSREVQGKRAKMVAIQGELGCYSEEAAAVAVPGWQVIPCATLPEAIACAERGTADAALVPVENSVEGPVAGLNPLLMRTRLHAAGEVELKVRHCLLAVEGQRLQDIVEVRSHPQALGQCRAFLEKRLANAAIVPYYDTAGAAKDVSEKGLKGVAAIASKAAARRYGLAVLAEGIEGGRANSTRFLLLSPQRGGGSGSKTTVLFTLRHEPGALAAALAAIAGKGANLTRLESFPSESRKWEYGFIADIAAGAESAVGRRALAGLRRAATSVKVLGSYNRSVSRG